MRKRNNLKTLYRFKLRDCNQVNELQRSHVPIKKSPWSFASYKRCNFQKKKKKKTTKKEKMKKNSSRPSSTSIMLATYFSQQPATSISMTSYFFSSSLLFFSFFFNQLVTVSVTESYVRVIWRASTNQRSRTGYYKEGKYALFSG